MAYQAEQTIREGARRVDEIHAHRQRRSVWPWVLGLIAVALAAWALLRNRTTHETTTTQTREVPSAMPDQTPNQPRTESAR